MPLDVDARNKSGHDDRGERRTGECPSRPARSTTSGPCRPGAHSRRRHRHRVDKSRPGRHSRPANAGRECRHLPTRPACRHCRRQIADRARAAPGGGIRGIPAESSPRWGEGFRGPPLIFSPPASREGVGGGHGTEKRRRHLLRRPHFPTVGDMVRFASRVKRKISFQSILFLQHLIHGHFFLSFDFPTPRSAQPDQPVDADVACVGRPAACRGTGRGAGR